MDGIKKTIQKYFKGKTLALLVCLLLEGLVIGFIIVCFLVALGVIS